MGILSGLQDYHRFWLLMVMGMVVYLPATFLTRPEKMDDLVKFYVMSRPIGWWGPVRREAERLGLIGHEGVPQPFAGAGREG
jgi:SSS family solute:Na+ symporter